MASTEWFLEHAARSQGWDLYSQISVLCEYIDRQDNDDAFEDFLGEKMGVEDELTSE